MRNLFLLATALGLVIAPGCAVTQAGMYDDDGRTVVRSIQDINAARTIRARMVRAHGFQLGGVDVEVREGVALLSGQVPRPEDKVEAERIAWSAPQVETIGNEILIGDKQGIVRNTKDGFIEKSVRTRLIASKVSARDLNVETHEGIVYMLGMVDSLEERDRAAQIAATTRGVREVVSYMKVRPDAPAPQSSVVAAAPVSPIPVPQGAVPAPEFDMPEEVVMGSPVVPASPLSDVPGGGEVTVEELAPPAEYTDPGGPPFYIDPDSGERIPVRYDGAPG